MLKIKLTTIVNIGKLRESAKFEMSTQNKNINGLISWWF